MALIVREIDRRHAAAAELALDAVPASQSLREGSHERLT